MFRKGEKSSIMRRFERFMVKSKGIKCALGEVLDLSGGGMRILCKDKPGMKANTAATLQLQTMAGRESVNVRCCWVKRRGFFGKHEIGLKFIGMPEEQSTRLETIAQYGFLPEDTGKRKAEAKHWEEKADEAQADEALREHYATLGLEPGAGADTVRSAYRKLVRACHPDVNQSPEAREQFLKLQASYDVLGKHLRVHESPESEPSSDGPVPPSKAA